MNIYTIKNDIDVYDCFRAHVIVANSEHEVRSIAKINAKDEGKDIWETARIEIIGAYTGNAIYPHIILSDFFNG